MIGKNKNITKTQGENGRESNLKKKKKNTENTENTQQEMLGGLGKKKHIKHKPVKKWSEEKNRHKKTPKTHLDILCLITSQILWDIFLLV